MKIWKLFLLLMMSTTLVACVSLRTPAASKQFSQTKWQTRQKHLKPLQHFTASGAFSIQEPGKKPVLANYQWKQSSMRFYRIRVFSPLNLFRVTILGHLGSVTLIKSTNQRVTASTPEKLLQREMGWSLPVRDLFYWIRGVIAPGPRQVTFDQFGHVVSLLQDGWHIHYSNYKTVLGYDLPQHIVLSRQNIELTLVIKSWDLSGKH